MLEISSGAGFTRTCSPSIESKAGCPQSSGMRLNYDEFLFPLSSALDYLEATSTEAAPGHGRRVACIAVIMAYQLGYNHQDLEDLLTLCLLHDSAISESERAERDARARNHQFVLRAPNNVLVYGTDNHCLLGEKYVRSMPFHTDISHVILCHHERADGKGPLGLDATLSDERAQLIHLADRLDIEYGADRIIDTGLDQALEWVRAQEGSSFTPYAVSAFTAAASVDTLMAIRSLGVQAYLQRLVGFQERILSDDEVRGIISFVGRIIDWKSSFTRMHSRGVAKKAERMAQKMGWSHEHCMRYYFAGALHDLGKLMVSTDILEKPGRLSTSEYVDIQGHAAETLRLLSQVHGLEDVCSWASNHHEKLDGSGYPRGLTAADLSTEDRLMACVDIYQALTERRPYKAGLSHARSIEIMRQMAAQNKIDKDLVEAVNEEFRS
ncbi:MAG: HD domain-containing phosphohydrolase [Atopobiaceae bacterium]|jgi:HD-GYP domain-containing protein (c-di-GMP phosphodiesterase class II)